MDHPCLTISNFMENSIGLKRVNLTHISLGSFLWDIGKQCKTRSDAAKCGVSVSDQVLHFLQTEVSFKI